MLRSVLIHDGNAGDNTETSSRSGGGVVQHASQCEPADGRRHCPLSAFHVDGAAGWRSFYRLHDLHKSAGRPRLHLRHRSMGRDVVASISSLHFLTNERRSNATDMYDTQKERHGTIFSDPATSVDRFKFISTLFSLSYCIYV